MKIFKNKIKFKYTTAFAFCVLVSQFSFAQKKLQFSIGTELNYGQLSMENANIEDNFLRPAIGGDFGVSYRLNPKFSLHTGIGFNVYKSQVRLNSYSSFQNTMDNTGEPFEFRYLLNNLLEKQKFTAISIPIAFQYETTGEVRFYSKIGIEANLFVSQEFETSLENITTTGYFPRFNATLDRPKFAGFGSFDKNQFSENDLEINNSYNATLELGIKKLFKNKNSIYVGIFAKYGLNDVSKTNNNAGIVSFNAEDPTVFTATSLLNAVDRQQGATKTFSEAKFHVFGTAITYEFSF